MYRGVWAVLVEFFRVPPEPPTLPAGHVSEVRQFRPSQGFLRYLKFWFWLLLLPMDIAPIVAVIACFAVSPILGAVVTPVALVVAVVPDILAYIAIHLRFDTTWYVLTDRSLRIRRGIWTIHETTITFENIQNVTVNQGPLQRHYGIANVLVQTAGGGGGGHGKHGQGQHSGAHVGLIEGVDNAPEIRDLILTRVKRSRQAGLGDEAAGGYHPSPSWEQDHVAALRQIRDAVRAMSLR
jgi:membrane protein YdbS with pleckstrin-like domain